MNAAPSGFHTGRPRGFFKGGIPGWYERGEQSADDPREYIMSSERLDRYGDVISADGWELGEFSKNPIGLFQHSSVLPIGTWSAVGVVGKKLRGRLNISPPDALPPQLHYLPAAIDRRVIRAVSVGFRPTKDPELLDKANPRAGVRWVGQELLECSLVTVPANPEALEVLRSIGVPDPLHALYFGTAAPRGMSPVRARFELLKLRAAPGRHV